MPDSTLSGVYHDNNGAVTLVKTSVNNIIVNGFGMDYSLDSNIKYFFTASFDSDFTIQHSLHIRKRVNVFENPAFMKSAVELNKRIYESGYLWYDSNYAYKTEALLVKLDILGQPIDSRTWGDLTRFFQFSTIDTLYHNLLIAGNQRVNSNIFSSQKFYLAKADTNLNLLWEKTYPQAAQPETHLTTAIARDRIYMCGYRYEPPWFDDGVYDHIIRKTDTAGNLLGTAYLPYKHNLGYPYCNILDDGIHDQDW